MTYHVYTSVYHRVFDGIRKKIEVMVFSDQSARIMVAGTHVGDFPKKYREWYHDEELLSILFPKTKGANNG